MKFEEWSHTHTHTRIHPSDMDIPVSIQPDQEGLMVFDEWGGTGDKGGARREFSKQHATVIE